MTAGGAARSSAQSQDAAGRNTTEFVGALVVGGERVTIRGGRAALNSPLIVAGIHGHIPPRPVVGRAQIVLLTAEGCGTMELTRRTEDRGLAQGTLLPPWRLRRQPVEARHPSAHRPASSWAGARRSCTRSLLPFATRQCDTSAVRRA